MINLTFAFAWFTAGSDYSPPPTNFAFDAGDTRSCINIVIRSDNLFESLEEFRGQATTTTPRVSINPSQTTVEITDIDGTCTLHVDNVTKT